MTSAEPTGRRDLKTVRLACDLVVVGGGLAGTCCAVTAARAGLQVVLVQDRPVLGGNASSEVRLWILGATSHLGNNNRWAREGGVIDEILVENLYRNPEGNPLILDSILLELVAAEPNLTLLLNTAVYELEKSDPETIRSVRAFCAQNATRYDLSAPLFCDASGDGIVGFLAGAAFRMGAESRSEFGEALAPPQASPAVLGHSLYFYSKDVGRPVRFVAPRFALRDITRIPRYRDFRAGDSGCRLWWLEWGGNLDTVHDTETIKWELWKVAYGVWDYIKNSGQFPEAATLTLEWVGTIPGKRESRRFEGDYVLTQQDLIEQRPQADAVSYGGWAIDLHPPDGVFSARPGCQQWHAKGLFEIPYRCLYSRNLTNLFLAGRLISTSHVAFGSTRVMATCAHSAQAVALAAGLCRQLGLPPRALGQPPHLATLQQRLLRSGQYIPRVARVEPDDLARTAVLTASSELQLGALPPGSETRPLDHAWAMMLPVQPGPMPRVTLWVDVAAATELVVELRGSSRPGNHTPDVTLQTVRRPLLPGPAQPVPLDFATHIDQARYVFVCLRENPDLAVHLSDRRLTGVLAVARKFNRAVARSPRQEPPPDSGLEAFEFWLPERRPGGKNLALALAPPLAAFGPENLVNGVARPTRQPNAWVAAFEDPRPSVHLNWDRPQTLAVVELVFDTDFDHPMESVLMGHPERVMPFCVREFEIRDGAGAVRFHCAENHQTRRTVRFDPPVVTDRLVLQLTPPAEQVPAALFEIRCYAP